MFCLYGASPAEVGKVGFELNFGDGPVVLGRDAHDSSGDACGAVAAEEVSAFLSAGGACISVLDMDANWVATIIGIFIVEELPGPLDIVPSLPQLFVKYSLDISLVIYACMRIWCCIRNLDPHARSLNS